MITKKEPVTSTLEIWALPISRYHEDYGQADKQQFQYKILSGNPWVTGAVKICEQPVTLEVPAGINLLQRAIETLEEAKAERYKQYKAQEQEINEQIQNLLLLGGPSKEDIVPTEEDLSFLDEQAEDLPGVDAGVEYVDGPELTEEEAADLHERLHGLEPASDKQETIKEVLMRRDGMTEEEAQEQIDYARDRVAQGDDPEVVLEEEFGLEPDYLFELL